MAPNRRLSWALSLVLVVAAGDRVLAWVCGRAVAASEIRFTRALRGGETAGVVVLGDSRGVTCCHAPSLSDRLGVPVLNLSYDMMSTDIAEAVLLDYLDRNAQPRLVILEVSNVMHSRDLLMELRPWADLSPRLATLLARYRPDIAMVGDISHLYRFNGEPFLRSLYYLVRSDQHWLNTKRILPEAVAATRRSEPFAFPVMEHNLQALRRIVSATRARGIALLLVVSPFLPDYLANVTNLREWLDSIREAAGAEVPLWDATRALTAIDAFADPIHLSERGSMELLDRMLAAGILPDRR